MEISPGPACIRNLQDRFLYADDAVRASRGGQPLFQNTDRRTNILEAPVHRAAASAFPAGGNLNFPAAHANIRLPLVPQTGDVMPKPNAGRPGLDAFGPHRDILVSEGDPSQREPPIPLPFIPDIADPLP